MIKDFKMIFFLFRQISSSSNNDRCLVTRLSIFASNVRDLNTWEAKGLNKLAKEFTPKVNHKSDEQNEVRTGKKEGDWIRPTKHVPIN